MQKTVSAVKHSSDYTALTPDHDSLAFWRLLYRFSLELSVQEKRALVYIRLHDCEQYQNADTLKVLSKLVTRGIFSPKNPEGLIEVAHDINRLDLKDIVKDFMKKLRRQRKEKASSKVTRKTSTSTIASDGELHLKSILEVTLSQTALFAKIIDNLQQAVVGDKREQMQRATKAIRDAGCTAQTLAEHFQKAQKKLEHSSHGKHIELACRVTAHAGFEKDYYILGTYRLIAIAFQILMLFTDCHKAVC